MMRRSDPRDTTDLPSEPPLPFVVDLAIATPGPGAEINGAWQGTKVPVTGTTETSGSAF